MRVLTRLARMDRRELAWRTRAAVRIAYDRVRSRLAPPRWDRSDLVHLLAPLPELAEVRTNLHRHQWQDAHDGLSAHLATRPQQFVISPGLISTMRQRVRREFPDSARAAAARADRILAGEYDLLGYRALRFDETQRTQRTPRAQRTDAATIDWHRDPVHDRTAPRRFWADVPYLEPSCGDHKIIWELNRHQHWLPLGRAFWLTGDGRYRERCLDELAAWLDANPPLSGMNWASMLELALRSLSWIWALNFFADSSATDREPWTLDLLLALDRQLAQVERNLSHYFSPNTHLLGEALALYVAGRALPELAASSRRAAAGRRILVAEIDRQIGADGGHCERSMHYHRYALDFYLLALSVARITDDPVEPLFERACSKLASAARLLVDDRGRAPHIGDDDGGMLMPIAGRPADDWRDSLAAASALLARPALRVGATPEEPFWLLAHPALAQRLEASRHAPIVDGAASAALPDTGYYVSRTPAGDHLVVDGGPHGYQNGGHAHADALSLTFTCRGVPLLIDPGTGCYTIDRGLRDRMRSAAMHNTLLLDDRDQSTPHGPFHWSQTAQGSVRRWRANGSFDYFDGAHDGYRPIEHRRHVLALHGDLLAVADLVDGTSTHATAVHWHVDSRWRVEAAAHSAQMTAGQDRITLHVPHGIVEALSADGESGLGWNAPVYGQLEPATTIRVSHRGAAPLWMVSIFGLNPENPITAVDTVPVWAEAGVLSHSVALRITRLASTDCLLIAEPAASGRAQGSAGGTSTWRVGELETDARMLFCRLTTDHHVTRVGLVDGSIVRSSVRRHLELALPAVVPDLHLDMKGIRASQPFEYALARIAGPAFGAKLIVGGVERPIAGERRARVRT